MVEEEENAPVEDEENIPVEEEEDAIGEHLAREQVLFAVQHQRGRESDTNFVLFSLNVFCESLVNSIHSCRAVMWALGFIEH